MKREAPKSDQSKSLWKMVSKIIMINVKRKQHTKKLIMNLKGRFSACMLIAPYRAKPIENRFEKVLATSAI